jgi:Flp pilus assembly protein TadD
MISELAFPEFRSARLSCVRASILLLAILLAVASAQAADVKIKVPKRTKPTPVQQLNQEGVKALERNDISRAKRAFYRAYLLDPDDPFTLNNLGYLAEIDGEIDKAQKFYDLAAATGSDAAIAFSNNPQLKGKQVSQVAGAAVSVPMQINRLNVAAMGLLQKERAPEAELILRKALALDPNNPFTLNNLGYALEQEGELEQAVSLYSQAADSHSNERVVVALNRSWRGRPISDIASLNAQAARRELSAEGTTEAKVTRLNLRGVSALNRNQPILARQYFQQAYRLDPRNAFSLNNMGYLSETEGDRETADTYYARAREANRSADRVTLSTRKNAEGLRLSSVADENSQTVELAQEKQLAALRSQGLPPLPLRTRDQAIVREPATPPTPEPELPVRIVAEDNPPPEPLRPATPTVLPRNRTQAPIAQSPNAAAPSQSTRAAAQPAPTAVQPAPTPLPTTQPEPQDETPLLPVIPDEVPPAR